jgi:hypothetical protein
MRIRLAHSAVLLAVTLLPAGLVAPPPARAQKPPIKIGFLAPLTGGAAQIGRGELQNSVIHTYPAVSQFWTYKPEDFLKQPLYTRDWPPCRGC